MELPSVFKALCITFRDLKCILENKFEQFRGSIYAELLYIVISYIIDIWEVHKSKFFGFGIGQVQYQSRPGGIVSARARASLVSW